MPLDYNQIRREFAESRHEAIHEFNKRLLDSFDILEILENSEKLPIPPNLIPGHRSIVTDSITNRSFEVVTFWLTGKQYMIREVGTLKGTEPEFNIKLMALSESKGTPHETN